MTLNIYVFYLILGGVEAYVLYRKKGKSMDLWVYLALYGIVIVLGLLTLLGLLERRFSYIMDFQLF